MSKQSGTGTGAAVYLPSGTELGPYVIHSLIGAGGMGEVYRARDQRLDRDVAVKVLPPEAGRDPGRLRRFETEAKATAAISHPNILAIYDVGRHDGTSYLVTELLEGESLRQRMRDGTMTVRDAVDSAILTARALSAAHAQGIVHRDLKPENLFLTRDGQLKVLDFGLARLTSLSATELDSLQDTESDTRRGTVLGTVGYMAPEQVRGEEADARADIFSLGVVLYELLARRPPFRRASAAETMSAVLRDDPPPLDSSPGSIPPALAGIVDRCLAKRPEDRFQSAHDLALALEAVSSPSWPEASAQAAPNNQSRTLKTAALACVAALTLVGGGLAVRHFAWQAPEADPALSPPTTVARRPPQNRVAVLPFVNKTGRDELDALSHSLAARVWSRMADVPDVDLVPMATVDAVLTGIDTGGAIPAVSSEIGPGIVVSGSYYTEGAGLRLQAVVQDMISGHLLPPAEAVCPSQAPTCVDELSRRAAEMVEIQVHQPKLVLMLNRLPSYEAYRAFFVEGDEERALAIDPTIIVRVLLYRAGDSYNLGDHEGAAESVRTFLEEHRSALTEFGTTMCRGTLAFCEGDIQLALTHDRRASELEPSDLMARGSLWDSAMWANRPYEAVAAFEGIAPCDNGFGLKVPIAFFAAGDFEGALEAARTYHACFPQWREMDDKEAQALAALGRTAEMEQVLERIMTRHGDGSFEAHAAPADSMYQAAQLLFLRGDDEAGRSLSERALAFYRRALDTSFYNQGKRPPLEVEVALTAYLSQAGREREAQELCQSLFAEAPDNNMVITNCAILAARRGDRSEAERFEALIGDDDQTRAEQSNDTYNRMCIAAQLGDAERAVDLLRQFIAQGGGAVWELIRRDSDLAPLRDNPAFQELTRPKG